MYISMTVYKYTWALSGEFESLMPVIFQAPYKIIVETI